MIRPIKNKNARPQLEWYTEYSSTNGGAIVHKKEYDMALEIYCDKLEKALDKACEILAGLSACSEPAENFGSGVDCKNHWKDWLLKDE